MGLHPTAVPPRCPKTGIFKPSTKETVACAGLNQLQEDPRFPISGPHLDCPLFVVCRGWAQGENAFLFPIVKTEAVSGACPLQGLLNCLKEIPEARHRHPSPSGVGDPPLQEDPGACQGNSGGKGHWLGRGGALGRHLFRFSAASRPPHQALRPSPLRVGQSCHMLGTILVDGVRQVLRGVSSVHDHYPGWLLE